MLGLTVNGQERIPAEVKKNEALEFPRPKSFDELRRYLGLMGWFRDFMPKYSDMSTKLYDALNKNKSWV